MEAHQSQTSDAVYAKAFLEISDREEMNGASAFVI
jgi:hypothetical protein